MFTPIRNLITYIQKNASGSTFFGGTSSNTELSDTATKMENEFIEAHDRLIVPTAVTELEPRSPIDEKNLNENNNDTNEKIILKERHSFESADSNLDPLDEKNYNNNEDDLDEQEQEQVQEQVQELEQEQEQELEQEQEHEQEQVQVHEEEEDEEREIFLDFPPEAENDVDFPVSEVIVLNDPDLNVSMNSEPAADPLALDDYSAHLEVNSSNPLDSSNEGDVLFVVDIQEVVGQAPRLIDEVEDCRQLPVVKSTDEQELRSDGSDSGLGSETSTLQTTVTSVTDTSVGSVMCVSPLAGKIPLRSNLKRHIQDVVVDGVGSSEVGCQQLQKKPRRSINFEGVKVFYFPRIQGHGCVPSQGGCTLGMAANHISFKTFSLAEHAAELRRAHKLQLQEINPRGSSSEETDSDEELSEGSGSDLDADTNGFLQPVSPKQRRALLKAAGIRKIDPNEKIECRDIRNSREVCGCVCRDFCDPDTCACSQAGIKCQVDRAMFPCGCSRDACGNAIGRIEFNPARVRTHFIHTIMRLDMENRQQKRTDELSSQLVASSSHLVYNNNVPALANSSSSTTTISTYNPMPSYGLDQSSSEVYHHHMQQQYNVYNNHMPPTHPASGLCVQLSPSMVVIGSPTAVLPPPHNVYANTTNTTTTEPDSIALNGGNLHYQDGSIYPPVIPPVVSYGDILAPYANTAPYENTQIANSTYSTSNVYTSYHNPHHHNNHIQPQQPFLGYTTACSSDISDFSETHNSFISLNTPEASSSRLSAINDLLHNNRNTTAALVAVSSLKTNIVPSEAEQLQGQISELPISNVTTTDERSVEKCVESFENSDISRRPETPPDEEPQPVVAIKTNDVVNELDKIDQNLIVIPESRSELTDETKQIEPPDHDLQKSEPASTEEVVQADVPACDIKKAEDNLALNDSSDLQTELSTKGDENGISNIPSPPIVETVTA